MNNIIFTLCTTEYTNLALDTPAREIGKWADMSDWVHKFPDIELHEWVDRGTTDREPSRRPYLPRQFFSARQHGRKRVVRQLAGSSSTARTCDHWRIGLDMRFSFHSRKAFRECDFRGWLEKKEKKTKSCSNSQNSRPSIASIQISTVSLAIDFGRVADVAFIISLKVRQLVFGQLDISLGRE